MTQHLPLHFQAPLSFADAILSMSGLRKPATPQAEEAQGWRDTLDTIAAAPPDVEPKSLYGFVQDTLGDPNPVHRAGLPLGLLGRTLDAERHMSEGLLGRLSDPKGTILGDRDPREAWYDNPISDIPLVGGMVPMILQPSTYLTLGGAPAAKISARVAPHTSKIPGAAKLLEGFVGVNKASEVPFHLAGRAGGAVRDKAVETFPRAFGQSAESRARELTSKFLDIFNFARENKWTGPLLENMGRFRSKGNGRQEIEDVWNALEAEVSANADPLQQAAGTMVLNKAREARDEISRRLEVMLEDARLDNDLSDGTRRSIWNLWYDQSRQVQEAARETIESLKNSAGAQGFNVPIEEQAYLRKLLDVRNEKMKVTRDDFAQRAKDFAARDPLDTQPTGPRFLSSIYQERDLDLAAQQSELMDLLDEWSSSYGPDGWLSQVYGPEVAGTFNQRLQGLSMNAMDPTTGHMGFLPDDLSRETLAPAYRTVQGSMNRMLRDRQRIADILGESPMLAPDDGKGAFGDRIAALQERGLLPNKGRPLTMSELTEGLRNTLGGPTPALDLQGMADLDTIAKRWQSKGVDPLNTDLFHASEFDLYNQSLKDFGGPSPRLGGEAGRLLDDATDLWKTYALTSTQQHTLNLLGGLMFQGVEGFSPWRSIKGMGETLKRMTTEAPNPQTGNWLPQQSLNHAKAYEYHHPHSLVSSAQESMLEVTGDAKSLASERMGKVRRAAIGAGMGSVAGGLPGAAVGAGMGLAAPYVKRANRALAWVMESNLRLPIWEKVFDDGLRDALPGFLAQVREQLGRGQEQLYSGSRLQGLGPQKINPLPPPEAVDSIVTQIAETGGAFGPKALSSMLEGVATTDQIQALTKSWVNLQHEASKVAQAKVEKIHFDYSKLNTVEETMKQVIPFATWFLRSIPFAQEHLAQNPVIARAFLHYNGLSNEELEKAGLPPSYLGYAPTGGLGRLLARAVLGQPSMGGGVGLFNPGMALPFGDIGGAAQRAEQSDTTIGSALSMLRPFGMGFSGPMQAILASSGILGDDEPLPNLLRYSDMPGQAVEAFGPEGLRNLMDPGSVKRWLNKGRSSLLGQDPFDYHQLLLQRRLAEKSMEETGTTEDPRYLAAMQDPNSPLYQAAEADVFRREFGQTLSGGLLPLPFRGVSSTEAAIRKENKKLPDGPYDTPEKVKALDAARDAAPIGGAYMGTEGRAGRNQLQAVFAKMNNPVIGLPNVSDEVRTNAAKLWSEVDYYDSVGKNLPQGLRNMPLVKVLQDIKRDAMQDPLFIEYMEWRKKHPDNRKEGDPSLIDQFFSQR